ncbi:sensor histidine kinase [Streptoalloteichus hindustanus]|uniref:Signal transduction histidine-protein kinase/phosphatase MprB n=1 Tax=Streptoalloteichus hindustanus TaxID=2017 RepID=A0A1M5B8Z8_STRHI|nr:HAMP domain-containing sensor histidine kinase [Streptoalloteichus hindustanus]SHF38918.1 Signal transduction histidine kinase [Streptoalloteichus hindustanus]
MRSRLLAIVLTLLALVLVGLGVPLAGSIAGAAQQELFLDRQGDTLRFAAIAQQPLVEGSDEVTAGLRAELQRYQQLYGVVAAVVDADRKLLVASGEGFDPNQEGLRERIDVALAGRPSEPYGLFLPWDERPMVVAEPIVVGSRPSGAAVTISSTSSLRQRVLVIWLVLLAAGLLVLAAAATSFAVPVVRWLLRPVQRLDAATHRVAESVARGRPAEPVGASSGPVELRRLTRAFDRMAASVADAMAAQRAFVADASHQLRNPLTALRLRLHNLDGHVDAEAEPHYVGATEEVERLATVLDDLLALARAEAAGRDVEPVDVDAVVADRLESWQTLAEVRAVRFRRAGELGLVALAPAGVLDTVLDAVLDNAVKFTREGSEVVVSTRRTEDGVELAVRDHGPGLTADELARATDRFWRSPAHQNVPGSGLGLAIVRTLVERAGGGLRLELPGPDDPDGPGGLRVVLRLPERVR